MILEEIKKKELEIRTARIRKLKEEKIKMKKIDFKLAEAKFNLGGQLLSTWVTFFIVTSVTAFLVSFIAFGDTRVSVCGSELSPVITNFCIGWQSLFMLIFSIIILPITCLIGTLEFFQSIKQKTDLKELSEQLQFQEDMNMVSKILVYSLFILAVQILIYFGTFEFLPDLLRLPFIIFDTDAMLPVALSLLYYSVRQRIVFFSTSSRLLYTVIVVNLVSVFFSRGVQLVWERSLGNFF